MQKNIVSKSTYLFYISLFGCILSILTGKIAKGQMLNSVFNNISIFDFLSGVGAGIAVTAMLASILVRRFGKAE